MVSEEIPDNLAGRSWPLMAATIDPVDPGDGSAAVEGMDSDIGITGGVEICTAAIGICHPAPGVAGGKIAAAITVITIMEIGSDWVLGAVDEQGVNSAAAVIKSGEIMGPCYCGYCAENFWSAAGKGEGRGRDDGDGNSNSNGNGNGQVQGN